MGWCDVNCGTGDGIELVSSSHSFKQPLRLTINHSGQLAFFNESKTKLKETSLGPRTQTFTASAIAGFFASFFSLPFDFVKTRFQRQTRAADGTLPDNGMLDAYRKVTKKEGILSFYRGFSTYCELQVLLYVSTNIDKACRCPYRTSCDDYTYSRGLAGYCHGLKWMIGM